MSELIDRAALIHAFTVAPNGHRYAEVDCDNFPITVSLRQIKDMIRSAPTIDAVQVVRCRDCAKRNTCDCPMGYAVEWGIGNEMPGDGDYCCCGARMDADAPER